MFFLALVQTKSHREKKTGYIVILHSSKYTPNVRARDREALGSVVSGYRGNTLCNNAHFAQRNNDADRAVRQ